MARTNRYCTPDDDVRVIIEKISDVVIDDDSVNYMIDIACDIIDSRLVAKYSVPFTETPPIVKHMATQLATYLVLTRLYSKARGGTFDNSWVDKFKEFADQLMQSIFEGDIILLTSSGGEIALKTDYGMKSSTIGYVPIFNEGGTLDWEISEDKVDDATRGR